MDGSSTPPVRRLSGWTTALGDTRIAAARHAAGMPEDPHCSKCCPVEPPKKAEPWSPPLAVWLWLAMGRRRRGGRLGADHVGARRLAVTSAPHPPLG